MEPPAERGLFRGNVDEFNDAVVNSFLERQQTRGLKDNARRELDLSMQRIRTLKLLQLTAPSVTSLDLNGNFITSIPPLAFDAFRLESLNLGANDLKEFSVFPSLTALRTLCLNSNKITRLSEDFTRLSQLEELQLRKNKVEVLNLELLRASATSLRHITLACNCVSSLLPPTTALVFPRLTFLCLFGNRLEAQPTIELLAHVAPNVEKLFLGANRFSNDKEHRSTVIAAFPKLQWLDWIFVTAGERQAAQQLAGHKRKTLSSDSGVADEPRDQPMRT